jgi:outer membrane protein assembly complex protein YaeT
VVEGRLAGEQPVAATLLVRAGQPSTITSLRLPGSGALERGLLGALSLRPGAVLDEERLAADLTALRAALHQDRHWRARLGKPLEREEAGGVAVEIPVEPGPRVTVAFRGNAAFTAAELHPQLGVDAGQSFDPVAVEQARDRLRAFYRVRGYAGAHLEVEERHLGQDLALIFHVDEGRRYRLSTMGWEGAAWMTPAQLRQRLQALLEEEAGPPPAGLEAERERAVEVSVPGVRPLREPPAPLPPGAFLDEVALPRALEGLIDEYRGEGFLEATLLGWSAELDDERGQVAVTIRLREGERTSVEAIEFSGNKAVPLAELTKVTTIEPGAPLVFERVEAARLAIQRLYQDRSYIYVRVEAREAFDPDPARHQVRLRYEVEEGPQVRIGRILVSGNAETHEAVVRRSLAIKEGALYDPGSLDRSQAALLRLGVFRSVGLRLQDPELAEPVKDLLVEVAERPWQYLAPGAGFSIANGPRLFLEYGRPNLLGRALELTARTKVNYPLALFRRDLKDVSPKSTLEGRADVGLRAPRLDFIPVAVSGRADLIGERLHRKAYDLTRTSGILGGDLPLSSRILVSLQYEIEVDRIDKSDSAGVLTQADQQVLRFPKGTTTLHSLRPSATFDFRDNAAHPHHGWFATGSAEYARSLGGPNGKFLFFPGSSNFTSLWKLQGTASGYLPLGSGTVLAASVRGGRIFPVVPWSQTIGPKRFFLGGADSIRGFGEEEMVPEDLRASLAQEGRQCASSVSGVGCTAAGADLAAGRTAVSAGGQAYLLLKGELRQSLGGSLELGLFVDLGDLWANPSSYRLLDLRPSVGFGLRFVTPVGPAALDLGFNLAPDRRLNEATLAPHFTIGLF